ncbi:methyltransferase domain-containing protein [Streptomyces sp. WM6378]|uniref:methyltransferase domain-containing protein n=1 Tax=Streptomyces sp. WM6378 TaxID=1415557 RepID=UPI000B15F8AF|nr:methyltransferase domain-containing protein [Streptomyces sp. WM6378]
MTAVAWKELVDEVATATELPGPWRSAFEDVPRGHYVPDEVFVPEPGTPRAYRTVNRSTEPGAWEALVHSNAQVVTQLAPSPFDGGPSPSSSSSAPEAVARMLVLLDPAPGARVLDLGSGTGWTAALLARFGTVVVTMESDPELAAQVRARLIGSEATVTALHGNATLGYPNAAPYDAVHVGFSVRDIPGSWIAQVRPGGRLVMPFGTLFANTGLLCLTVREDGQAADGRFRGGVRFMWERGQRPHWAQAAAGEPERMASPVDPRTVLATGASRWAVGLQVPAVTWDPVPADGDRLLRLWCTDGSWATVTVDAWNKPDGVTQCGPRNLWDEVCAAWSWWDGQGRPGRNRFGVTAGRSGSCRAWLDSPQSPLPGALEPATRTRPAAPLLSDRPNSTTRQR